MRFLIFGLTPLKRLLKTAKSGYWLPHVCPSVRIEKLGSQWTNFHEICYLSTFFSKICRENSNFIKILTIINATLQEHQYTFLIISRSVLLRMKNVSDKNCRENQNTHFVFSNLFSKNRPLYEIMCKNIVEPDRLHMTIWHMRIACWIPKATYTHSEYVILIAFPLQHWLHEQASVLCYTYTVYIACLV